MKSEKKKKKINNFFEKLNVFSSQFFFSEAITRQLTTLRKRSSMKKFKKSGKNFHKFI